MGVYRRHPGVHMPPLTDMPAFDRRAGPGVFLFHILYRLHLVPSPEETLMASGVVINVVETMMSVAVVAGLVEELLASMNLPSKGGAAMGGLACMGGMA